jgi:hypothetical protein
MVADSLWLAAEYLFCTTYSIRAPGSGMANTKALPAPGPGTVRMALIRAGIEIVGFEKTEQELFPIIRSAPVLISPPDQVSVSVQKLRGYKAGTGESGRITYQESLMLRETAHAQGPVTIFMRVPQNCSSMFEKLFFSIGYWGQANSLTTCYRVYPQEPERETCAMPVEEIRGKFSGFYSSFVSEFSSPSLRWQDLVLMENKSAIKTVLYAWPLTFCECERDRTLLLQRSRLSE